MQRDYNQNRRSGLIMGLPKPKPRIPESVTRCAGAVVVIGLVIGILVAMQNLEYFM